MFYFFINKFQLIIRPVMKMVPQCKRVTIVPVSIDDWEILVSSSYNHMSATYIWEILVSDSYNHMSATYIWEILVSSSYYHMSATYIWEILVSSSYNRMSATYI